MATFQSVGLALSTLTITHVALCEITHEDIYGNYMESSLILAWQPRVDIDVH